jgi:hypothetical protein
MGDAWEAHGRRMGGAWEAHGILGDEAIRYSSGWISLRARVFDHRDPTGPVALVTPTTAVGCDARPSLPNALSTQPAGGLGRLVPMKRPIPSNDRSSAPRIPLHSALAQPVACAVTSVYAFGVGGMCLSAWEGQAALHPGALLAISLCLGLMVWKMWGLCQRVYMTRAGIELTNPARVIPWRQVGDTFRVPLLGSWPSTYCLGINEPDNWDLHFFGRADLESVVAQFRAAESPRASTAQSTD